ncbi:MAG: hypothetical protein U9R56_06775 [candidate division Zixibacteria bacterium]|nr:hypothetical protein [candidate division Zixibacteria bacterium]
MKDKHDDFNRARKTLKIKQRLMASFVKSSAFSSKYRLRCDYMEIVRREFGMMRVELAEDIEEFREDW